MKARKPLTLSAFTLLVVALSVALATAGCDSEEVTSSETTATTGSSAQSTTSVAATVFAPPLKDPELETRLSNGRIRGLVLIRSLTGSSLGSVEASDWHRNLHGDYVEMLTGEEARQAAIKDGVISAEEELPNDYYIRNEDICVNWNDMQDPLHVCWAISPNVSITTCTFGGGPEQAITWEQWSRFWDPLAPPSEESERLRDTCWWIEREGGTVVSITEQPWP